MFIGRYEHLIDKKGRISIPAKFREILSAKHDERLIISAAIDECLQAFPIQEWQILMEKFQSRPQFSDSSMRNLRHAFMGNAIECPIDKQGRIQVPGTLRDFAALTGDVVFVGMSTMIEIWDKARWNEVFKKAVEKIKEPGALGSLGL